MSFAAGDHHVAGMHRVRLRGLHEQPVVGIAQIQGFASLPVRDHAADAHAMLRNAGRIKVQQRARSGQRDAERIGLGGRHDRDIGERVDKRWRGEELPTVVELSSRQSRDAHLRIHQGW